MSDRTTERQLSRSERPNVTPQPTRPEVFDWIEDKFVGREAMPRYFELHLAYGPGASQYRPETLFQKEFKPNMKKPERDEMVELANKFVSFAQSHCNELGKAQRYVLLAINHMKGAAPYGVYLMGMRPNMFPPEGPGGGNGHGGGGGDGEDGVQSDAVHRDRMLTHSLEHQKASDEHTRFMYDILTKSWANTFTLQQDMVRELRTENQSLKSMQLEYYKAMQEALSTADDRKMKNEQHRIKMELLGRGADMLMQMIPVVAKSLERGKGEQAALPANGKPAPSPESMAIEAFNKSLSDEQKAALFGFNDPEGNFHPGVLKLEQVQVIAQVGSCVLPPATLDLLMPGGGYAITEEQIAKIQEFIPQENLMPLYALMMESSKSRAPEGAETQP